MAERQTITNQLKPTGDYPGRPPSVISLRCFRNRTYGEYKAMVDELGASTIATMCLPPTTAVVARSTTRRSNSEILRDTEGALGLAQRALAAATVDFSGPWITWNRQRPA